MGIHAEIYRVAWGGGTMRQRDVRRNVILSYRRECTVNIRLVHKGIHTYIHTYIHT